MPKINLELHVNKNPTDWGGWINLFDEDDRVFLCFAQKKHPKSIIRSPNADLIASGYIRGIGGCVPVDWDGSIYDWHGRQIREPRENDYCG